MADILIKNAMLLTMDGKRRFFDDGAVAVEGNKIVAVGKTKDIVRKHRAERVIDAKNMVLMPGLINGHNHYEQSFMKGLTRLFTGHTFEWIKDFKTSITKKMNAEDYYLSNLLACVELMRFGATCSVNFICQQDPSKLRAFGINKVVKAIVDSSTRTNLVIGVSDAEGKEPPEFLLSAGEGANMVEQVLRKWHGQADGRIHVWAGPFAIRAATPELWLSIKNLVNKYGTGMHSHINGGGDAERAYELGLMTSNFTAAHCPMLNEKEISLFAKTGAKVVHNPTYIISYSNSWSVQKFGDGLAPVSDLLRMGVTVGVGTDGCLGDTQDMFREMRNMAFHQQYKMRDKTLMPPTKLLEMATIDCAKTMLWDKEIGSIEVGKKADLILVETRKPYMVPWTNTPASLVYLASGHDVNTTIIDGKIVMENKHIKTVNVDNLLAKAQDAAEKLIDRAGFGNLLDKGFKPWCSDYKLPV